MADHVRQQIREALVTTLTGLATTGTHVFASRVTPLPNDKLPALLIETNNEQVDASVATEDFMQDRKLDVVIRVVAKSNNTLDEVLDTAMKEVEGKLYQSLAINTLNGLVQSMALSAIDVKLSNEVDKAIGQASMLWSVNYFTRGNAPDVSI